MFITYVGISNKAAFEDEETQLAYVCNNFVMCHARKHRDHTDRVIQLVHAARHFDKIMFQKCWNQTAYVGKDPGYIACIQRQPPDKHI